MKFGFFTLSLLALASVDTFATTLSCRGTHGNQGHGTLDINQRELRFTGTQIDSSLRINKPVDCSGARANNKSNPSRYNAAGSCGVFGVALVYDSGVLMLVDDSRVEEPEVSATYFCR